MDRNPHYREEVIADGFIAVGVSGFALVLTALLSDSARTRGSLRR
jgi:hypothetical protein